MVLLLDEVARFVFVTNAVDQSGGQRLLGGERSLPDGALHVFRFHPPSLGDAAHEFAVPVFEQRLGGLPVRRREFLLREDVRGVFVFADVIEVGRDAELVERPFEERARGHQPVHVQLGLGQDHDRLAGGGEVVGAVARKLQVGHAEFTRAVELPYLLPDLLQLGHAHGGKTYIDSEPGDARVRPGALQGLDHVGDGGRRPAGEVLERVLGRLLGEVALDFERQHRARADSARGIRQNHTQYLERRENRHHPQNGLADLFHNNLHAASSWDRHSGLAGAKCEV